MFGLSSILLFGSSARSFEDDAVCEAKQDTGSQIGKFLTRRVDRDRVLGYEGHARRTCDYRYPNRPGLPSDPKLGGLVRHGT